MNEQLIPRKTGGLPIKIVYICLTFFALLFAGESASAQKTLKRNLKARPELHTEVHQPRVPNWELRTAPIAFLASWYTIDLSYRITDQIATGPAAVAYSCEGRGGMFTPCMSGSALGWQAKYYPNSLSVRKGLYLGSHAYYDAFTSYPHGQIGRNEVRGFRANGMVGYMFQAPLNVLWHLGAGWEMRAYDRTSFSDRETIRESGRVSGSTPMFEAKLGFQF